MLYRTEDKEIQLHSYYYLLFIVILLCSERMMPFKYLAKVKVEVHNLFPFQDT